MERRLLITIDGPAGAGKTTVSRQLAERLHYVYVDTGALYRAVALAASRDEQALWDDKQLGALCHAMDLRFEKTSQGVGLFMNGEEVSNLVRTQEITMLASRLSAKPVVRAYLLDVQRKMGVGGGAVFEGRDMGTVVFPNADVKFFLHADPKIRAVRRHQELLSKGTVLSLDEVYETMRKRDQDDSARQLAPLKPAEDAVSIDSTSIGVDAVVEAMLARVWDAMGRVHSVFPVSCSG
jgi:cytidylate kinase